MQALAQALMQQLFARHHAHHARALVHHLRSNSSNNNTSSLHVASMHPRARTGMCRSPSVRKRMYVRSALNDSGTYAPSDGH